MADEQASGMSDVESWNPFLLPGGRRFWPILRLIIYVVCVPFASLVCGIIFEVRLEGGYGTINPGAIVVCLVSSLLMVRFIDGRPLRSFGLTLDRLALRDLGIGLLIPAVELGLIFGIERTMGWVRVVSFAWNPRILGLALLRWADVALNEELESRGYIFQILERLGGRRVGSVLAITLTSTFFGLAHGGNPHASPMAIASLVVVGLEFGTAYLVTRRLWMPIAMHFGWNLIEGTILGFPVSGMPRPSFVVIEQGGPDSWTGAAFGPEAGYLCPALSLIDIGVMLWLARQGFWKPQAGPIEAEALANPPRVRILETNGITFLDDEDSSRVRSGSNDDQSHSRDAGSESEPLG